MTDVKFVDAAYHNGYNQGVKHCQQDLKRMQSALSQLQEEVLKYKEALQQIEQFTLDLIGEDATVKPFVLQVAQRALGKSSDSDVMGVFDE